MHYKKEAHILHEKEIVTKKFLRDHRNVAFTRADKGNITVALDKDKYIREMELTLSDEDTYVTINKNPIKKVENILNSLLRDWLKNNFISNQEYKRLRSSDGNLPRAYGVPKIHKVNHPLRIIVSSIGSPLHSLAQYIHNIIIKSIPPSTHNVENSFELDKRLNNIEIDDIYSLSSLDVVSMFINIPIELAIKGLKRWRFIKIYMNITQPEFVKAHTH